MFEAKSKIDWNLKYQFPKQTSGLFDYQVKSSKLDILNKNLEKKIKQSSFFLKQEPDDLDGFSLFNKLPAKILEPPKLPSTNSKSLGGPISFLEAVSSLSQQYKDTFKQQALTQYTSKNEKAPPPADLFSNLQPSLSFA